MTNTEADRELVILHGICMVCGAPRDVRVERDEQLRPIHMRLVCTRDQTHGEGVCGPDEETPR